jgi:hypothetical protein
VKRPPCGALFRGKDAKVDRHLSFNVDVHLQIINNLNKLFEHLNFYKFK